MTVRWRTIGGAHGQPAAVKYAAAAVAIFGRLVHDLVVGRVNIVRKLDLRYCRAAQRRSANTKAYNALHA